MLRFNFVGGKMWRWYAVRVYGGKEQLALRGLYRQGYEAFLPSYVASTRKKSGSIGRLKPLFPGYLFVHIDPDTQRWQPIDSTTGVKSIVRFGQRPAALPEGLIESLIAKTNEEGCTDVSEQLSVGDKAQFISGAFERWVGEVIEKPDQERVILLLNMLSRKVKVSAKPSDLFKA